jgi:hypothetical protein
MRGQPSKKLHAVPPADSRSLRIRKREVAAAEVETIMRLNENSRFIALTLGVFSLTLGAAVILFSLIERLFLAERFAGSVVVASSVAIALGAFLLRLSRRRQA